MSAVTGQVLADALTRVIDECHHAEYPLPSDWPDDLNRTVADATFAYADLISKAPRLILAGHLLGLAIAALRNGGVR